ncbi:MAG: cell division protein FtsZ [Candidatus Ryanbacteria bacterium RIFCSPHIGHO2_12_FULL_47_12b]|uniref:Cell division protein FtsZ n=2 Tax=Candidatus Ryaniibacteriota TaxID=1817914 RepID=A0A1G2H6C6_9BACT|nr:MAG: Cell division protein ftsZ [Parcubacteria group bacterium GW2011_GWA2_47_10b]OGZ46325.1 MAG: cell division protein FtsZ [Candidatus Ryanbacteria bacterium RIFCSPHIGHO2_01_FULL_48_80]OGZ50227.1 MAG: cell division protein FtsZ [Candidatus Ryanbacteria bacterium RIFCSPHIGHO2_02_FULL_47_25]OGZ51543.1 MAG: cell division protein FtsZ [Candidatus Ryanbacteria bacterium RIFCSPHIGHO2_12_FULL_47_12b]OGZ52862.1 MAG: cell division protein FtsZ [Candidatus Ryanbacteria bacterium RIFCSPLOWO2_01_FULL_
MPRINPDIETFARIKVFGVGGSGLNAIDHMIRSKVLGVDFVGVNTDAQDLHHSLAPRKIHIGKNITKGLGAGMDSNLGRQAAEENKNEIIELVRGVDMVFLAGGFGGGTCTGAAPIVADIARNEGALTVAVVTKPFSFEGSERARIAEEGLARLKEAVDAMIVIPNDRLLGVIEKKTTFLDAFATCDEILRQAVQGISDLITLPGIINVDFADIRSIMKNAGSALMGIGKMSGEDRAREAARAAISSPLLDLSINGAHGVLFSIAGGDDLTMWEVNEAAKVITESIAKDAKVIFGAVKDERLRKGEVKITVVASGFGDAYATSAVKSPSLFSGLPKKEELPLPRPAKVGETEDATDEWDAIPAFLRRTKK